MTELSGKLVSEARAAVQDVLLALLGEGKLAAHPGLLRMLQDEALIILDEAEASTR